MNFAIFSTTSLIEVFSLNKHTAMEKQIQTLLLAAIPCALVFGEQPGRRPPAAYFLVTVIHKTKTRAPYQRSNNTQLTE